MNATESPNEQERDLPLIASKANFESTAIQIAELLLSHAIKARDGSVYWRHPSKQNSMLAPQPLGPHLYAGTLGISLFFAAMSHVFGDCRLRDVALRAITPLRTEIQEICCDPAKRRSVQQPIGGLSGLGSIIYSLVRIGGLLYDSSIVADAHLVSSLITPERIVSDKDLDIMTGSAGALLALVALDEQRPEENLSRLTPIEGATLCARHLIQTDTRPATSGFCHGEAGILNALSRLHKKTGETWLKIPLHRFTRTPSGNPRPEYSWCKGAPGIALGQIGMLEFEDHPSTSRELAAILELTGAPTLNETDDLCCGNCGRIDVLLFAARKTQDSTYREMAVAIAHRMLKRAGQKGRYSLKSAPALGPDLRLFPGLAGIGYTFTRLLAEDLIPCSVAVE